MLDRRYDLYKIEASNAFPYGRICGQVPARPDRWLEQLKTWGFIDVRLEIIHSACDWETILNEPNPEVGTALVGPSGELWESIMLDASGNKRWPVICSIA
jgi:hypothetical protein